MFEKRKKREPAKARKLVISDEKWTVLADSYQENPAHALAGAFHYSAVEGMNMHKDIIEAEFKRDSVAGSRMMADAYLEYILLFMHLMNRTADAMFGRQGATTVQHALLPFIVQNAGAYFEGNVAQTVMRTANDREQRYAHTKYWVSPPPIKSPEAQRDMNATRNVFRDLMFSVLDKKKRADPFDDLRVELDVTLGCTTFFSFINLQEWLKGVATQTGIANFNNINLQPPGIQMPSQA
jgi:hypothetical protein